MSLNDPFANGRYDIWKTTPPEPEFRPLVCSRCGKRFDDIDNHDEGEAHCYSRNQPTLAVGFLEWDDDYDPADDGPDPDEAYDRMREGDY